MRKILEFGIKLLLHGRIFGILSFAFLLIGCASPPEVEDYLPEKVDVVAFFRLGQIVRDKDLSKATNIGEFKKEMEKVEIPTEEITRMISFTKLGPEKYAGVIR